MALASAMAATPELARAADPAVSATGEFFTLRTILSLAFVLGLLFVTLGVLRRLRFGGALGASAQIPIASRGRLDLGAHREIRLVDVGGRILVVGVTNERMELLADLPGDAQTASLPVRDSALEMPAGGSFAGVPRIPRFLQRLITSF
jgi:flagellar biogenesis protein FliO